MCIEIIFLSIGEIKFSFFKYFYCAWQSFYSIILKMCLLSFQNATQAYVQK